MSVMAVLAAGGVTAWLVVQRLTSTPVTAVPATAQPVAQPVAAPAAGREGRTRAYALSRKAAPVGVSPNQPPSPGYKWQVMSKGSDEWFWREVRADMPLGAPGQVWTPRGAEPVDELKAVAAASGRGYKKMSSTPTHDIWGLTRLKNDR